MEEDAEYFLIVKIQAVIRRFLARSRILRVATDRYEKIYDYKRQRFYYYDKISDTSSWFKPAIYLKNDITVFFTVFSSISLNCISNFRRLHRHSPKKLLPMLLSIIL